MMKKNVTLMLVSLLVMMFSLTGCGASTSEVNALRQEIASLEEQVDMLEEKQGVYDNIIAELQATVADTSKESAIESEEAELETSEGETVELEIAETDAETTSEEELQNLMAYIEEQIKSNDFDSLLEVAECEYVTSEQLVEVAKKCAEIDYYEGYYSHAEKGQGLLADSILANDALTDEALKELLKSKYVSIWFKVAASEKCSSITLFEVAQKCTKIDYYEGYYSHAEKGQGLLTDVILGNPALTDDVVRKLLDSEYPSVWFKALSSNKCSEETLILAAQKCVKITYYDGYYSNAEKGQLAMAEIILQNPALTENVLNEFVNSKYSSVVSLGHQTIETIETSE